MSRMVRKQIYIESQQEELIKAKSKELNVSEAELIRRGIDATVAHISPIEKDLTAWNSSKKLIKKLIGKGSVKSGRKWRREELYDR